MPISVDEVEISDRAINIESAFHQGSITERQHRAATALVVRELLRQRLREIDPHGRAPAEPETDALIEALLAREVWVPDHDEAACRRYYAANPERFRSSDAAAVRHILLAAAPADIDARDRARRHAGCLIAELRQAPQLFARLARVHSACPSREHGGSLGRIERGQTVPEFESVVLRLPLGLSPRALETRYGYHVVWVDEHHEGEQIPYTAVRGRIAQYLHEQVWRHAVSQYIRVLAERHEIKGINLGTGRST